ncbi:MAG: hypothetical protein ACK5TK_11140 [Betaproteobacteria bacterium]
MPATLRAAANLPRSARNGCEVVRRWSHSPEREFALMLDADRSGTVGDRRRNAPKKRQAVGEFRSQKE